MTCWIQQFPFKVNQQWGEGGRVAQWMAFSLHTQWPRVQFSAFPKEIYSLDAGDINQLQHCLVRGQCGSLIMLIGPIWHYKIVLQKKLTNIRPGQVLADGLLGTLADACIGSDFDAAWRRVNRVDIGLLHWWYYVQLVPASGRASSNNISGSKKWTFYKTQFTKTIWHFLALQNPSSKDTKKPIFYHKFKSITRSQSHKTFWE